MKNITLKVEGMTCGHCKQAVESALSKLEGIQSAEVDLANGTVNVSYDEEKVDAGRMKTAIEDQGYDVAG